MKGRTLLIVGGGIAILLVLFIASLTYRAVPQPIIEIKGETIAKITIVPGASEMMGTLLIRNTLIASWCVVVFVVLMAWFSGRNLKLIPTGWQNFVESAIEGIQSLVINAAGEKNGRRFFWVIATFLIYVAISNWFALLPVFNTIGKVEEVTPDDFHDQAVVMQESGVSLVNFKSKLIDITVDEAPCDGLTHEAHDTCIEEQRASAIAAAEEKEGLGEHEKLAVLAPYLRSVNTDLMTPLSLAIASAIFVEFWGVSSLGFFTYSSKFFNFRRLFTGGFMGAIDFFVGLLELIAEIARLISFSFRLFGNMLAGEILLLVMTFLLPFTFVVVGIFYGLEIFVGAIQAFVFGMLTLVFAVLAVSGHGDHEDHAEGEAHEA